MKPNEKWIHSKDGKNLNDVDLFDSYHFKLEKNDEHEKIPQAKLQKRCVIKNMNTTQCNTIIRWEIQNPKSKIKSKDTIDTWAIQ